MTRNHNDAARATRSALNALNATESAVRMTTPELVAEADDKPISKSTDPTVMQGYLSDLLAAIGRDQARLIEVRIIRQRTFADTSADDSNELHIAIVAEWPITDAPTDTQEPRITVPELIAQVDDLRTQLSVALSESMVWQRTAHQAQQHIDRQNVSIAALLRRPSR